MNKIRSVISKLALCGVLVLLLCTCAKEYSFEGGAGGPDLAIYTMDGEGSACGGSVLSGTYTSGVPLNVDDKIELRIHVTKTGAFNQSTSNVNGVGFSANGILTDTGWQTITLAGNGTPQREGLYNFSTTGSSCSFSIRVDKKNTGAQFSFAGAPNTCQNAAVKGTYVYGDALKATNTVDLIVNVTAPGTYDVHTDTLNGISFYASGTFSSTGEKTITLTGSGTPGLPGSFDFTPRITGSSCTFNVEVTDPPPLATYVLESGFGNTSPCIYTVSGTYAAGQVLSNGNTVSVKVYVTAPGNFTIASNKVNGISFAYTGTFATAGGQTILLKGQGTPIASGTFSFVPRIIGPHPIGGEACGFEVTVQ